MTTRQLLFLLLLPLLLPVSSADAQSDDELYIPPVLHVTSRLTAKPSIEVFERRQPRWVPLLPYLFFDNPGETIVPERYVLFGSPSETKDYADSNGVMGWEAKKYHEILNIIGNRMQRHPEARLQLRGAFSAEGGEGPDIARERSEVIRDYLVDIWRIESDRIEILPPERRADTLANNALQEEARRVEFTSDHPEILAPTLYPIVGLHALPVMLETVLQTNQPTDRIDSIIFVMMTEDLEVIARKGFRADPDSSTYSLSVMWEHPETMFEDGLILQAMVRRTDGTLVGSNRIGLPIIVREEKKEQPSLAESIITFHGPPLLSVLAPGDSVLGTFERDALRRMIALFAPAMSKEGEPREYVVIAKGQIGMEEIPGLDPVEANVELDERRDAKRIWEGRERTGQLFVAFARRDHRGARGFISPEALDDYEAREADREETEARIRKERMARPELRGANTIADGRARAALSFIRDSTTVVLVNDRMTPAIAEKIAPQMPGPFGPGTATGLDVDQSIYRSLDGGSQWMPVEPESRFYARGVDLMFFSWDWIERILGK